MIGYNLRSLTRSPQWRTDDYIQRVIFKPDSVCSAARRPLSVKE
jgi:hypothetical protein